MSWIGLAIMLVGAIVVFIDPAFKKHWKDEPEVVVQQAKPDPRIDELLRQQGEMKLAIEAMQQASVERAEKTAHRMEYLEQKVQNQKPPVVQVQMPERLSVDIVSLPDVKGEVAVKPVKGQPLRLFNRAIVPPLKARQIKLGAVKRKIEELSK